MATNEQCKAFIEQIAPLVQKHIAEYERGCSSAIIAQACLESGYGGHGNARTQVKASHHNYFGLKYRTDNRVTVKHHTFSDVSQEQNADGSYRNISCAWYGFDTMENGVIGYLQWTNVARYTGCKHLTDPEAYLNALRTAGYATSLNYVKNCMAVIDKWNLRQYDTVQEVSSNTEKGETNKMVINVHAGHNPDGKVSCGAVGLIKESTENRNVKNLVIQKLQALGHTVYDCTVDNGTSQSDVLKKIVAKCNAHTADLDISIHFNAGAKTKNDGRTTGTEVFVYSASSKAKETAERVVKAIAELGYTNRGVGAKGFYVLKNTKSPAMLIECCFVDDPDDVALYSAEKMANAIVKGIAGTTVATQVAASNTSTTTATKTSAKTIYRVQVGAYMVKAYASNMMQQLINKGYSAFITTSGNFYKVQVGAFTQKANAEALRKKLLDQGFNAIVVQ